MSDNIHGHIILAILLIKSAYISAQDNRTCTSNPPLGFYNEQENVYANKREELFIPIVFHVVYHNNEENISDDIIYSQLQTINDDYNSNNLDITNVPAVFQKDVGNVGIEFCLASEDPFGNPSTGIIRVNTPIDSIGGQISFENGLKKLKFTQLGGSDAWDTEKYLNVWISNRSDGIIGTATFPNDPDTTPGEDGIELDYRVVGNKPQFQSRFNIGRTLTHEIGHYLNLDHPWGKTVSCFNEGDMVEDTPVQGEAYFGCSTSMQSSCGSRDMVHNFMGFMDDACLWYFTKGQANKMVNSIFKYRYGLLSSGICSDLQPIPDDPLEIATIRQVNFGLQINLGFMPQVGYRLDLYDISGRHIWTNDQNGLSIHLANLSSQNTGVYILTMNFENQRYFRKFFYSSD